MSTVWTGFRPAAEVTIADAREAFKRGLIPEQDYRDFAHAWQTRRPRREVRAYHCRACSRRYPTPQFVAL